MVHKIALAVTVAAVATQTATAVPAGHLSPRIFEGGKYKSGNFPFIVSISHITLGQLCGGALIDAFTVLTAAHCLEAAREGLYVRAGSPDRESGGSVADVISFSTHPQFDSKTQANDIATFTLSSPINGIRYAQLAESSFDLAEGSMVTLAGWGHTTSEQESNSPSPQGPPSFPRTLREVSLPIANHHSCQMMYKDSDWPVTENMVCIGDLNSLKNTCRGDSGGPAIDANTKTLFGIISFGPLCGQHGVPGILTRVGSHIDFIKNSQSSPPSPPSKPSQQPGEPSQQPGEPGNPFQPGNPLQPDEFPQSGNPFEPDEFPQPGDPFQPDYLSQPGEVFQPDGLFTA